MPDILSGAIIAAGRGERLRSATAGLPKPLVELDGKALLLRQIELMQRIGLKSVYVIVNTETAGLLQQRGIAIPAGVELVRRRYADLDGIDSDPGDPHSPRMVSADDGRRDCYGK